LTLLLDSYERKTRLLALFPIATTITTLGWDKYPAIASVIGALTAAGGPWVLASYVGDVGRKSQPDLFNKWGGSPTTAALRTRKTTQNPVQRDAWRDAVQKLSGVTLSTAAEEAEDPVTADHRIEAAATPLLRLGRPGGVEAVWNENIAFGYQRNLYAFRHIGRAVALLAALVQVGAIFPNWKVSTAACIAGASVAGLLLLMWTVLPSEDRTKDAAGRYARQLYIAARNEAHDAAQTQAG
jgi:hypothetical protein